MQSGRASPRPFRLTTQCRPEDAIQRTLAATLRLLLPPDATFTSWESRNVGPIEGGRRKARGVRAGWPDLGVFWRGRTFLFELKTPEGALSLSQREMHRQLRAAGHEVHVCRREEDVLAVLAAAGVPLRGRIAA